MGFLLTLSRDYRTPAAALGGMLFAVALIPLWTLSPRWFAVVIVAIGLVSLSLALVRQLDDFLLASHLLFLPLSSVQKWLFLDGYPEEVRNVAVLSGAVSVGITEILLLGMYAVWAIRIFVARTLPLPRLGRLDVVILLFVLANVLSIADTADLNLSLFAIVHLLRHFFVYFYFARRLQARHLPWVLVAFSIAIVAESLLGLFQYQTGMLKGLILDKGQGGDSLNYQYEVPGIEDLTRAVGTSYDSHSFGLFLTMLLPFPLTMLLSARVVATRVRVGSLLIFALGCLAVFVSFSRSSWLTLAITTGIVWLVFLVRREKRVLQKTALLAVLALIAAPRAIGFILQRFDYEGYQNLTARYDQFPVALEMWKEHLWLGQGIGSYMIVLREYLVPGTLELPVHNVFLWLAADTGILGVVTFFALIASGIWQLLQVARSGRGPLDLMAVGAAAALGAYVIDGFTNPLFRESLVYMLFWFMLGLSVALPRIARDIDYRLPDAAKA